MRKRLLMLLVLCLACSVYAGEERALKLIYKDYKVMDEDIRPISFGAVLWENRELPDHVGFYGSLAMFTYGDWRFEVGGVETWNKWTGYCEIDFLTGISVKLWDRVVVGGWFSPFWDLYGFRKDDPYGIMIGYTLPTP